MRLIFSGLIEHAQQLLGDFESDSGLKEEFNTLLRSTRQKLRKIKFTHFSGNVKLPTAVYDQSTDRDANYLRPLVNVLTNDQDTILIAISELPEGVSFDAVMSTIISVEDLTSGTMTKVRKATETEAKRYHFWPDSLILEVPTNVVFKTQPSFKYNTFECSERQGVLTEEKGTSLEYNVRSGFSPLRVSSLRIRENTRSHGVAFRFGKQFSKACPKCQVEYSNRRENSYTVISEAWDWNLGNPRFLTEKDYKHMAELARTMKPYNKALKPYLKAHGFSKDSNFAENAYAIMESLYNKGFTNPLILPGVSVVLAHESTAFMATMLTNPRVAREASEFYESRREKQATDTIDEVVKLGIGSRLIGWRQKLPSPEEMRATLSAIYHALPENEAAAKKLHDLFAHSF